MSESDADAPRPVGRPSVYNLDMATEICSRLASGEALKSICRDEAMPGLTTVYRWLASNSEFRDLYTRAREDQADTLADEIIEISDDGKNDWMKRNHGEDDPGWVANGEHIQRSRLRVEARKWIAAKLKPKKYGDRLTQEVTGKDGKPLADAGQTVAAAVAAAAAIAASKDPIEAARQYQDLMAGE